MKSYNSGVDLYISKEYKKAAENFKAALKEDEKYLNAYNNLGCAYIKDGMISDAEAELKQALEISEDIDVYYNLVLVSFEEGSYQNCAKLIGNVSNKDKNYKQISLISGIVSYRLSDYDAAIASLARYLRKDKTSFDALFTVALANFKKGDYDAAIKYFKESGKHVEPSAMVNYNIAAAYMAKEDYENATEMFNKALEIDGSYYECYFNLAVTYLNLKDYEKSRENFEKYLDARPDAPDRVEVEGYISELKDA